MWHSGHIFTGGEVDKLVLFSTVPAYLREVIDSLSYYIRSQPFLLLTIIAQSVSYTLFNSFSLSSAVSPLSDFFVLMFLVF